MKRFKRHWAMTLAILMVIGTQSISVLADETDAGADMNVAAEGEKSGKDAGNYAERSVAGADETVGTEKAMTNEEAAAQGTTTQGGIETYADNYVGDDVYGGGKATSGKCGDNLTWTLSDDGTLTISGTGKMYDYRGWDTSVSPLSQSGIKKVIIEEGVTSVGNLAFARGNGLPNDSLLEVTLPESLEEIAEDAFMGCTSLKKIMIPANVTEIDYGAFLGCSSLVEVQIGDGLKRIGSGAFSGCSSLEKIMIPANVTEIDDAAFSDCSGLIEVQIGDGLKRIGNGAFSGCSSLKKVSIPNSVEQIGYYSFQHCTNLKEIAIPANVTTISEYTFSGCSSLASVTIPNSVTKIEYDAFKSCTSLPSVTVPASVTSIKGAAFGDCSSLSNVYFEGDVPVFSSERKNGYVEPMESFANVTANVYYPYGNATYTADNMLDYGGKLTWIARNRADELAIVLEVTDKVYLIGSGGNATIKCTGELRDFVSVAVDGQIVDPSCYTTAEGSTVLTFLSSYLDKLSVGDHVVTLNYTYGSIDTTLTILDRNANDGTVTDNNQNTDAANNGGNAGGTNNAGNAGGNNANKAAANGVPKTGDATSLWMLWVLCASSGVCIFSFVMRRKSLWKN